jgi:hypothetical protein
MSEDQAAEETPSQEEGGAGPESAPPGESAWDGNAASVPAPDGDAESGNAQRPKVTDEKEESFDYDNLASRRLRADFPKVRRIRDVAGRDINYYVGLGTQRARGPISIAELTRAARLHVTAPADAQFTERLREDRVVFLRGGVGTGRRSSAVVVLDRLTGSSRDASRVTVLEAASGLADLPERLEAGSGQLLDASEENWVESITEAQVAAAREALKESGFLVILVDGDTVRSLPGTVVDHALPDLGQVAVFHLAGHLSPAGTPDRTAARALIDQARRMDEATDRWYQEITTGPTAGPAEAALFAEAIWTWHERPGGHRAARPPVEEFRGRHRYRQAAELLRRGDGTDSPLRQSYAISAAVLDGLAVSEVVEGAGTLSTLLAEVEHPGAPGHREIFAQPLARWLRHVEMVSLPAEGGNRGGTVVKMPSRELSRILIEIAWRNYDAARQPVLAWLMRLCEEHPDDRVRIRAVQALAFIAQHDYALIKTRVLEEWSTSGRPVEHLAAAWLLEAMMLEGAVAGKVKELLRRWSRSGDPLKRAVAVRAYGTAIAKKAPQDAIQGVRFSAADPLLSVLPELALQEMYLLGLTRQVMAELTLWMRGFPMMRLRSGRTLVRIAKMRRIVKGDPPPYFDLLYRLAYAPDEAGIGLPQVAALWHMACRYESSRSAAWQTLGRWAQSCRDHPGLRDTFGQLVDEFEKAADTDEFKARLGIYRRRWAAYLDGEDQK